MTDPRIDDLLQASMRDFDTPNALRLCKTLIDRNTPGALLAARIIMVKIAHRAKVIEHASSGMRRSGAPSYQ
jgi:hypothetical protein